MRHRHLSDPPTKIIATAELVLAAAFWGLGYVAGKWALTSMGPYAVVFLRFSIALLIGWLWLKLKGTTGNGFDGEFSRSRQAGISLGLFVILMTLSLQYTSVTRCGFLTGLYVVFVPILEAVMLRSAVQPRLWVWIVVAILGTTLMCGLDQSLAWNVGDLFAIACAFVAAYQIVIVDRISSKIKNPFAFNAAQSFWALLPALGFVVWANDVPYLPWTTKAYIGIAIMSIGCTLFGFWLQIRAQKVISATVVSILFLLETIFAAIFGYVFFDEVMNVQQSIGALLILLACYRTVMLDKGNLDRKPAKLA